MDCAHIFLFIFLWNALKAHVPNTPCTEFEEGSPCPTDFGCFLDYSPAGTHYDSVCKVMKSPAPPRHCKDLAISGGSDSNSCECKHVLGLVQGVVDELEGTLGRGDSCDHNFEGVMRWVIKEGVTRDGASGKRFCNINNEYRLLWEMKKLQKNNLCDRRHLLTCDSSNRCACFPGTIPRTVTVNGIPYESDHCYAESGDCDGDALEFEGLGRKERNGIQHHYSAEKRTCEDSNYCVFVDERRSGKVCTTINTGNTGYDGTKPIPEGSLKKLTKIKASGADARLKKGLGTIIMISCLLSLFHAAT